MEQGKISDYTQTNLADRVRRAHAQRHSNSSQNVKKSKITKSMPFTFYNQGSYNYSATHETKRVLYKHICSVWFLKSLKILHMLKLIVEAKLSKQKSNKSGRGSSRNQQLLRRFGQEKLMV